jgi:iron complex transport system permease protein
MTRASTPVRRRPALTGVIVVVGLVACALSVMIAITLGTADISLVNVRDIIGNHLGVTDVPVRVSEDAIVWQDRLPRSLVAAAAGAGLAICGVVLQSLLRNPLADPFLLGISSGASTGAVLLGILGLGAGSVGLSGGAFIGALVAFGLVLLLARLSGGTTDRLVLAGIAVTQLFSALTSLVVFAFADADEARGVLFWLLGSLEGVRWGDVRLAAAVALLGVAVCWVLAHVLDAFTFGDDVAASLGVPVTAVRSFLLVMTALVTAALVSVTGAIGFVGLVLPHAARFLVGPGHARLVPVSAVVGAVFMVWVDAVSRVAFSPTPLPIGVATALIGVPAFVALMFRRGARA